MISFVVKNELIPRSNLRRRSQYLGIFHSQAVKKSNTVQQSVRDYRLTIITWPIPPSWSLENTISPTENSILERDSPLMCPRYPSPSLYETSVAAAPLCSCQQGRVCVCVCMCVYALVEVGFAGRLAWGVL